MKNKIIAVIGAGGKTTLIHRLAEEYRRKGASVLVSTTTHCWWNRIQISPAILLLLWKK